MFIDFQFETIHILLLLLGKRIENQKATKCSLKKMHIYMFTPLKFTNR